MMRSEYYSTLSGDVKRRFDEKLKIMDNIDPYTLTSADLCGDLSFLPAVTIMDMVNYLILTHSFYTGQQLKAYKSLLAYKYYEAGFVHEVLGKLVNEHCFVVVGKVRHSQKSRDKPLQVWIILLKDGAISSAHCTCMAGLGEVCSHVAAILFYLKTRSENEVSCTEKLSNWPVPATKNVDMVRISEMDWAKKRSVVKSRNCTPPIGDDEIKGLLGSFEDMGISSALSRVVEPFATKIAEAQVQANTSAPNLPNSLLDLFRESCVEMPYSDLLKICEEITMVVTPEQAVAVESCTRNQLNNKLWFTYRAGRITASKFKLACRARLEKPPLSLIKGICYPQKAMFYSVQTEYGIKNEPKALQAYQLKMKSSHENINFQSVGFFISIQSPQFGASPDAVVNCDCCGSGCVEVKCPYTLQDIGIKDFALRKNSCLVMNSRGEFSLDHNHGYYYQLQLQMYATQFKYCDFVLWSKNCLYIERIYFDQMFCTQNIAKAMPFFNLVIKPELLGRYFTKKQGLGQAQTWCVCKKPDDGRPMLRCDKDNCEIEWYHFECMNMVHLPSNFWFCPNCQ